MNMLLETRALTKSFGGVKATDTVNLGVREGETHAIIGPNGAGKTTLVSILSGAVKPDSGSIHLAGKNITAKPVHTRARLGIARSYQITSLIMTMSVIDNVSLAIQARKGHSFRFIRPANSITGVRTAAHAALEKVGLAERANDLTVELSHGEHRLMELAMALASEARLMLLDEPMAGLGPEETLRMVEFLKTLKQSRTILLVEHDMDAVFALADRISVLVYGRIIATGEPDEIRTNDEVRRAYLGEA